MMVESFYVFFKQKDPDGCQICLGKGKLDAVGLFTGKWHTPACPLCNGTGKSDAPLFTDADSVAFDEWNKKRVTP